MRALLRALLFAVLILALFAPAASAGGPFEWGIVCGLNRTAPVDPIVYPGLYGVSHEHDLFGGDVTKDSTYEQLRSGDTSCAFNNGAFAEADKSGYWVPHDSVLPVHAIPYYRLARGIDPQDVTPFPKGFQYVAGDSHAGGPQPGIVDWGCGGGGGSNNGNLSPVDCDPSSENPYVKSRVKFPSCLERGLALEVFAKENAVYPDPQTGCPATHPKEVPMLELVIRYQTSDASDITGEGDYHADFFEAWDRGVFRSLIGQCFTPESRCNLRPKEAA